MREYELEVLEQYDIEVISTRKTRGAYFCNTKEGLMLLGPAGISVGRAPLMYVLLCYLESRHGMKVDTPIFTKAGKLFSVSQDGTKYMLKKWVSGRECEVRRERDVLEAAQALGLLHQRMDWGEILGDGAWTKEKMQEMIPQASDHEPVFERMYEMAQSVTERMECSGYPELYKDNLKAGKLIHGDYNYHNIWISSGRIAVTNFEHFRMDVQVQDLYYFLRKVMEKYQWKESLGRKILEMYESVRPLEDREKEFLALCLAYPEKFWKTANLYSNSNKARIPEKSVEKLQTAIGQQAEKERFLENIFTFHL